MLPCSSRLSKSDGIFSNNTRVWQRPPYDNTAPKAHRSSAFHQEGIGSQVCSHRYPILANTGLWGCEALTHLHYEMRIADRACSANVSILQLSNICLALVVLSQGLTVMVVFNIEVNRDPFQHSCEESEDFSLPSCADHIRTVKYYSSNT